MYAKVEVKTSEPIVSFKETIISEVLQPASVLQQEKVEYEKHMIDKSERRVKKERVRKAFEGMEDDDDEVEVVEDTGVDEEEDKVKESIYIYKKALPKNLVSKNYAKAQLKAHKVNISDVKKKTNVFETLTPNQRFSVKIRAVALKYEVAKWLESKSGKVRKLFGDDSRSVEKVHYSVTQSLNY